MEKLIGRCERIFLPDLEVGQLNSKVDTGAYGISIHVDSISVKDGCLEFNIDNKTFTYKKYKTVNVKSSFGEKQKRFCIFTRLKMGNSTYKVYVSLTDRKDMKYPVLIGRRFLHKFDYLVDVRKKYLNDTDKKV